MRMTNLIKVAFVLFFGLCCVNFAHAQWNNNGNSIYTDATKQVQIGSDPVSIKSDEDFTVAYNSDGLDLVYSNEQPPADADIDIDEFLKRRTILSGNPEGKKELKDTQISQVFYNTSAVFNTFFHPASHFDSDLETVDSRWDSTYNVYEYCTNTIVRQNHFKSRVLLDNAYDPLQAMVAYCHDTSSGKGVQELIWSFRMNDTHDDVDRHLISVFKSGLEETCWLNTYNMIDDCPSWCPKGGCGGENCHCMRQRETTLDYSCQVVRDQVIKIFRSVVENYDVDGIELDFLRHPVFFPSQMEGDPATIEEIAMMTALVTELRVLCDSNGIKLAIRVTDSMDLNKEIGLDVVDWLENDLVDIVIAGGYWHLEPWSNLAKLGSQYEVKVYADISLGPTSNSRFGHITNNGGEQTRVIYGEILSARYAGLDGVYFFNKFETGNYNPFNIAKFIDSLEVESPLYYELIQPSGGNHVKNWIRDGERFIHPNRLEIRGDLGANSTVTLESDSPALKFLSMSAGQKSYRIVNENSYLQFQSSLSGDIWDYGQPTIPLRIANSGNIDVFASGFIDSDRLLNINGNATANNLIVTNDIINQGSTPYMRLSNTGSKPFNIVSGDGKLQFQVLNTDNTFDFTAMAIYENGDITMGFGPNDIRLTVKEEIHSDYFIVDGVSEDRVFDKSYYLRTLKEIEQFIETYKHLPEIPPAVETEKSVNLSEFYGLMLRKIEELTLYTIQKEDQIEELEKGLAKLKSVAIKEGLIDGPE